MAGARSWGVLQYWHWEGLGGWEVSRVDQLHAEDPRQVGPFRVLERLGAGGMGQVYLGASAGGRRVAIKVIHPQYASDPDFRRRFGR